MQVLVIDPSQAAGESIAERLAHTDWQIEKCADYRSGMCRARAGTTDALVVVAPGDGHVLDGQSEIVDLLRAADTGRVATILLTEQDVEPLLRHPSLVDVVAPDAGPRELTARLSTAGRYQALVRRMEQELSSMERLGKRLNRHFVEVEQEMRLAGRLQRDFLPQIKEPVGPITFSTLFRPASWVSGDIYDVFRVDEQHVAFYVADAVGHGMAASLLTMFIKKAINAKVIYEDHYEVLTPGLTMKGLNEALAAQALPNCQFVTACYCLFNMETLELSYARGGHPYPLLVSDGSGISELKSTGGLLGLFPEEEFETGRVQLHPDDKLILYTDGLEVAYDEIEGKQDKLQHYRKVFSELAGLHGGALVEQLALQLDRQAGSLNPADDVTVLVAEVDGADRLGVQPYHRGAAD